MKQSSIKNKKFNKLKAIEFIKFDNYQEIWLFECSCKEKIRKEIRVYNVINNITKSCGCLQKEAMSKRKLKNKVVDNKLYATWQTMKQRCHNPNNGKYHLYGGRGIKVCEEWRNSFQKFYNWAINNGYEKGLTNDRINNNLGYRPNNCRWVDMKKQGNNRRTNHLLTLNNKTQTLQLWAEEIGINPSSLRERIKRNNDVFDKSCIRKKYG